MTVNKQEFLAQLSAGLSGLPVEDREERLAFYEEMIDDRVEESASQEEAIRGIGTVEELVSQTVSEIPLTRLVKEKITPKRRLAVWEIVLLVLGSPIWLSLLLAVLAVMVSLYAVLWTAIICLWAAEAAICACALAGIAAGLFFACNGNLLTGIAVIGAGIACAGLGVFLFRGCLEATKGIWRLTRRLALWTKTRFVGKGEAK